MKCTHFPIIASNVEWQSSEHNVYEHCLIALEDNRIYRMFRKLF